MLRQLQLLVGAMMGSLVVLAVVLVVVLPAEQRFAPPPLWLLTAQFLGAALAHLAVERVGYRTRAIHPETDDQSAAREAASAYSAMTTVRFAMCEVLAVASFISAFLVEDGSVFCYATGASVSLSLIAFHAWPWSRPVDRTLSSLEREGGRSYLRETLGLPPKLRGAIREL